MDKMMDKLSIKGLIEQSINTDAKIIALTKLLADQGVISLEDFNEEHKKVMKKFDSLMDQWSKSEE
ncbi:hypothetical protein [Chengkuizengella axinellae]|uniref:Phage protein n=1 Tax=Chengkuizengella axinellae TaxID=3064388 RepID=A0ABT9J206_9BACL|nr:hypothetical protein [Chengkuizengella sp. 2205SS18-9]MDP5275644.1 hypothetical protein [Chengkuizengella sp. 2205SS18-9]